MSSSRAPIDWRLAGGVAGANGIGLLGAATMPLWLGAVMDRLAIDETQAGLLGSAELMATAIGSLWAASRAGSVSPRRLATGAAAAAAISCGLAAAAESWLALTGARVAAGLFAGAVMAAGNGAAARAEHPDRLFAVVALIAGLAAAGVLAALPLVLTPAGYAGGFAALGLVCLVMGAAVAWLPAEPLPRTERRDRAPLTLLSAALLLSTVITAGGSQGLWSFSERIGVGAGLDLDDIAVAIAIGSFAGLLGSVVAAVLDTRFGRTGPVVLGTLASGASQWGLVQSGSYGEYLAAQVVWGFAFFFVTPYVMGIAAGLDRAGRWTAAVGGASLLGSALGPLAAGSTLDAAGAGGLGGLVTACAGVGAALLWWLSARHHRT